MRQIRCLLYDFVNCPGKGTKTFEVLAGDRELEVRTATYGPEIDQSQHARSVSHITITIMLKQHFKNIRGRNPQSIFELIQPQPMN